MLLELRARLLRGEVDAAEAEELLRDTCVCFTDPASSAPGGAAGEEQALHAGGEKVPYYMCSLIQLPTQTSI